ncbi:MAG: hypothetical protein Rsou_2081 [Candidatus Ruthia sp. Asou_11_S2]|nr:hypothetical protein [Candidatus Ruthia sp. Asou_11_S2]
MLNLVAILFYAYRLSNKVTQKYLCTVVFQTQKTHPKGWFYLTLPLD